MIDKIFGACIRNIPSTEKVLYLTFDDGPHEHCTPKVLHLLSHHHVHATFFVVAETLRRNLSLGHSIVAHGHNVGNHSLDHKYHYFFLNDRYLMNWVGQARDFIEQALQVQTIGFRSPLGIRTPHLGMALRELQYPLVLWNQRFFLIHGEAFPEPSSLRSYPNSNPGTFFYCMTRISSINDHFLRV